MKVAGGVFLDEDAPSAPQNAAFRTFLLKVHARCNLACTYCYVYAMDDRGWERKPVRMAPDVVDLAAERIAAHARCHELSSIDVVFHGGEPLLLGASTLVAYRNRIAERLKGVVEVRFGLQTNGLLLDPDTIHRLVEARISVGISLDGPALVNDRRRPDHAGRGSHRRVVEAVERIARGPCPDILSGYLAVIDVDSHPADVLGFFQDLGARRLDLLLPHGHHDKLPPGMSNPGDRRYGRWLVAAFDEWFDRRSTMRVRMFADMLKLMLGGRSAVESLGLADKSIVVVESDGAIEPVDTLRSVHDGATELGFHLVDHSFDDVMTHPAFASRFLGAEALCGTCRACPHLRVCGGGYLPHRYSAGNGYMNTSIYCEDLRLLCEHVEQRVRCASAETVK